MTKRAGDRYGVPPLRQVEFERVLLPGGQETLTLAQLERRCLARLATVVANTAIWPADGFGQSWRIGDFIPPLDDEDDARQARPVVH